MCLFIIDSDSPINIFIQNSEIYVDDVNRKGIMINENKSFLFHYFFCKNESLLYSVEIVNLNGSFFTKSEKVVFVKLNQNEYYIKTLSDFSCFSRKKCKKITKNGDIFTFYQNGDIEIETDTELKFCDNFDFEIEKAEVVEMGKDFWCIKLFGKNTNGKAIFLDKNYKKILVVNTGIIEISEYGFKALTDLRDISCHGLVECYSIENGLLVKTEEYSVYLKDKPQNRISEKVLPIYFLQCIKALDFNEARNCLCDNLKKKVSAQHLKQYFGNFSSIILCKNKLYLLRNNLGKYSASLCSFSTYQFKITNVEIIKN